MGEVLVDRKRFLTVLGACCACGAVQGARRALAGETPTPAATDVPATRPGDLTVERAAKRMEFADGWVRRLFVVLDQELDEPTRRRVLEANGKACYVAHAGPPARQAGPDAVERFRAWVAAEGATRGYSADGATISFQYESSAETGEAAPERLCLCPMAESQANGRVSPTFCHCSVGYVREMHERLLGRPVKVELVDSVLRGGTRCRFTLTIA